MRQHYIDNLRTFCILLLVPFHTAMAWNCWGEQNYIWFGASKVFSSFVVFVSPWYMALLFVLAGMSLHFSFYKRTILQIVKERFFKCFLPLLIGTLTVVPVLCYFADCFHNGYKDSFLQHYKIFFTRFTTLDGYDGGFTPGHLWFLLYLFVITLFALLIISIQKRISAKHNNTSKPQSNRRATIWQTIIIYALAIVPLVTNPILNIGGKSVGLFLSLFLIGYYVFSCDRIIEQIAKLRFLNALLFLASSFVDVFLFIWQNGKAPILNTVAMQCSLWLGILTFIGMGKVYFNKTNKVLQFLASRSFLFYILHFVWVVALQFYCARFTTNTIALFLIPVFASYILTFATTEVVFRIRI